MIGDIEQRDSVVVKEYSFINGGLSNLTDEESTTQMEKDITILNLHCNKLSSLKGLPHFKFLTEINLSSNDFSNADMGTLAHLQDLSNLRSLDLSGNYLTGLNELPFLPRIESFFVAFNSLSSLSGLTAFPSLQSLDVRGNKLASLESFSAVQELSSLQNIQLSNLEGRYSNQICEDESELIRIFDSFAYAGTIDKKGRQEYADALTERTFGFEHPAPPAAPPTKQLLPEERPSAAAPTAASGVDREYLASLPLEKQERVQEELTPKFDNAVRRFRHRYQLECVSDEKVEDGGEEHGASLRYGIIGGVEVYEDDSDKDESEPDRHPTSQSTQTNASMGFPPSPASPLPLLIPRKGKNAAKNMLQQNQPKKISTPQRKTKDVGIPSATMSSFSDEEYLLTISSGDDDTTIHNSPRVENQRDALEHLAHTLGHIISRSRASDDVLQMYWTNWKNCVIIQKLQEKLLHCEESESVLLLRATKAEGEYQQACIREESLNKVEKELSNEKSRNSALQDRLIAVEQDCERAAQDHVTVQESLTTRLLAQEESAKNMQELLAQAERKYSQSLQDITADVVHISKVMEGKDATMAELQANKTLLESEINSLRTDLRDLSSAREKFVCPDCSNIKSFFDSMQHDMQHLVERKVQLENDNAQIPLLNSQITSLKDNLTAAQLDFTKQVSEIQRASQGMVSQEALFALEAKHALQVRSAEDALAAKEHKVQECLKQLSSAKDALMEYDDKCVEMEGLLHESQLKNGESRDVKSELERAVLDAKKKSSELKKKDLLIFEMKDHVVEVKDMLQKLADKCRSLEYVNEVQLSDLSRAQSEIHRLEEELVEATESNRAVDELAQMRQDCKEDEDEDEVEGKEDRSDKSVHGQMDESFGCSPLKVLPVGGRILLEDDLRNRRVSPEMFGALLRDFGILQSEYDSQTERISELKAHVHELEHREEDMREEDASDKMCMLIDDVKVSPLELHEAYHRLRNEHDQSMNDLQLSIRIKDKMVEDLNSAIRTLKERQRGDESRIQESVAILKEENDDILHDLSQLEQQLAQSREQERLCADELHVLEKERTDFQEECRLRAKEEVKPYRLVIQEKDALLEEARKELASICKVVADMKSNVTKKDHVIDQLKQEMVVVRTEKQQETNKYLKEKSSKTLVVKDVKKMKTEILQSLAEKDHVIKDLEKSLKRKKASLIEAQEKILQMEQLFGNFQQLAANILPAPHLHVMPSSHQKRVVPSDMDYGAFSIPIPSHLLRNEATRPIRESSYASLNGLKDSISDISAASIDSNIQCEDENDSKYGNLTHEHGLNLGQSQSPNRRHLSKKVKSLGIWADDISHGSHSIRLPESHASSRHVAGRSYTDLEISQTNSANILELSQSDVDDSSAKSIPNIVKCDNSLGSAAVGGSIV